MRASFFLLLCALCLVLCACISGCGDDGATRSSTQESTSARSTDNSAGTTPETGKSETTTEDFREYQANGSFATISIGKGNARPEVDPPDRPAPKKILVRDLEVGTGQVARPGDLVSVHYVGINYKTGKEQYGYWPPEPATETPLTFDTESKAWEETIAGMKEGGLREMIIPSHLLFGTGTIDYVLELMDVEPGP